MSSGRSSSASVPRSNSTSSSSRREVSRVDRALNTKFFHGMLTRTDAEELLKDDGYFILRASERKGQVILALTVRWNKKLKHFVLNLDESGKFYFERHKEKTIHELIDWHITNSHPVSKASGAKLIKGVQREPWLLCHDEIMLQKKLGEGAFGEVHMARYIKGSWKKGVAVKTMRDVKSRVARVKFMREARIMRKFHHPNVVRIYGVAIMRSPLMIVMELCPGGSVLGYIRKMAPVHNDTKLRFVAEASAGLAYLESKSCIHRDIAARNCLLSGKYEVKISDFGMSDERNYIRDAKLDKESFHSTAHIQVPMKWLAPETMQQRIFSTKTDVWAFGIMAWEIYADGREPYPGMTNVQARAKIVVLNYRMEMPKTTPPKVEKLVYKCWETDPDKRPSFAEIFETLDKIRKT
uniref:Tyrosine-protein kinase n=1 Tax=Ascaris suum TaxID=6253 RepID=F1L2U2_ASCSU